MKKSIVFVFAAILALNTVIAENVTPTDVKDPKTVHEQLTNLLKSPEFEVSEEIVATVTLVVNKEQEVIVLDVDTSDDKVASFIKARLNYEKIEVGKAGEHVILPVRILPGE